jgi:hypothetical protein
MMRSLSGEKGGERCASGLYGAGGECTSGLYGAGGEMRPICTAGGGGRHRRGVAVADLEELPGLAQRLHSRAGCVCVCGASVRVSSTDAVLKMVEGRGVSGYYGEMDETCPVSTRGKGALQRLRADGSWWCGGGVA